MVQGKCANQNKNNSIQGSYTSSPPPNSFITIDHGYPFVRDTSTACFRFQSL